MEKKNRNEHYEFGVFAEEIAAQYYISKGYTILERNWRLGKIEIDIIAQTGNTIVFIEVKARKGDYTEAKDAVTIDKMKRMTRGADAYLKRQKGYMEYRYDIFALTGDRNSYTTEVFEDAFYSPLLR